jgi:hypothetical protein
MGEKRKKVNWKPEIFDQVANEGIRLMRERAVTIKWESHKRFGLLKLIMDAQKILPKELQRPETHSLTKRIGDRMQEIFCPDLAVEPHVEVHEAPSSPSEVNSPPPVPNRLGLDPRFAESLVYVAQSVAKVIGDAMAGAQIAAVENAARAMGEASGAVFADSMRQVLRDIRLGMFLTPATPAKPEAPAQAAAALPSNVSALPEKFNRRKILVIGMLPDQQDQVRRRFPRVEFRFAAGNAPANTVESMSKTCELAITSKFCAHKSFQRVACKLVHAQAVSGVAQRIEEHFPELKAATAAERAAAGAAH